MRSRRLVAAIAAVVLLTVAVGYGQSSRAPFKIGVLVDCTGIGAETHDWSLAAAELPLLERGGRLAGNGPAGGVRDATVAGRRVELVEGCSESGVYGRLITETRQLVEIDRVDAVVGAFGWSDGMVFRELARRYPTVPFLLAGSFSREATTHAPAPNLYRFTPDVEQEQAGLATYAYRTLGWRSAATVAEQTPNGWGATAAFAAEFCALGGQVRRVWTPYFGAGGPLLRSVPPAVDGVMVLAHYGYGSPAAFIRSYLDRHPDAPRSLLLSVWLYPPAQLPGYASLWPRLRGVVARISGVPDPSSAADVAYRKAFAAAFPGLPASVAAQPPGAAVLHRGRGRCAVAGTDARGARSRACPPARSARLASPRHAGRAHPARSQPAGNRDRDARALRRYGARQGLLPRAAQDPRSRRDTRRPARSERLAQPGEQ